MGRRSFVVKSGIGAVGMIASLYPLNSFFRNEIINIGIIGTGDHGSGLISIIEKVPSFNLIAFCDIRPFRLENVLSKSKDKVKGYSNYREILDDRNIDLILVATPFNTHAYPQP